MKTTIEISDDLLKRAKALAAKRRTTLRAIVERGLRIALKEEQRTEKFELSDMSVDGEGLQPAFRHAEWQEIRDATYRGRGA